MRQITLIALGSNDLSFWGSSLETVAKAVEKVAALSPVPPKVSRFFHTPAFPAGIGPDFVNAVMQIETELTPAALLAALHEIEQEAGRERKQRWGQRSLDLDLLTFGYAVLPDQKTYAAWRDLPAAAQLNETPNQLILPHPRLQDRAFVLVPWCDIAPDYRHPTLPGTIAEMCAALPMEQRREVVPIDLPQSH